MKAKVITLSERRRVMSTLDMLALNKVLDDLIVAIQKERIQHQQRRRVFTVISGGRASVVQREQ